MGMAFQMEAGEGEGSQSGGSLEVELAGSRVTRLPAPPEVG